MNIYEKINEVRKKIAYIKKDTTVGDGRFAFKAVSHDAVTALARDYFVEQGIIIVPSQKEKGVSIEGTTKSGTQKIRYEAMYDIVFVNMEDSQDKFTVTVEAHAEGSDDKCPGKALSYATKSAMLKVLMLETGESDELPGMKNSIDAKQLATINQLIVDTNTDVDKFCIAYGINSTSDLPSGMFLQALSQLQKKQKSIKQ